MKGLLVTYWFPPKNSIASLRTYAIAKYLNEHGLDVEVLCPDWKGSLDFPRNFNVHYTHRIEDNVNYGYYQSKVRKFIVEKILYRYFKYNLFRDTKLGAFYFKAAEALKNIDLHKYDFVITSFGPLDVIHIGQLIKKSNPAIKWIIDYRDHFSLNQYNNYGIYRPYFKNFEKKITAGCDGFVTVSKHLLSSQQMLIKKPGTVCYNGFDDYQLKADEEFVRTLQKISLPLISHTGSLYSGTRNIEPFFRFYFEKGLHKKFSLVFAIINDEDEAYVLKMQKKYNIQALHIFRNINLDNSIALQEQSRYLLLFTDTNGKGNGYLTGKFFEYMRAKKPIIYSGATHQYEQYVLLKELGIGEHFEKFDYTRGNMEMSDKTDVFHRREQVGRLGDFVRELIKE